MIGASAAFALFWAALSSVANGPVPYNVAVAADEFRVETPEAEAGSQAEQEAALALSAEQAELMAGDPDWRASARLYHAGGGGATGNDSLGCRPIAMRTVAVDPRVIPRRTKLFIRETVGLRLADGTVHDGYWYASDTGGAIKGAKIDLYTGHGRASMRLAMSLNMKTLTIADAGDFDGCPPAWETASN
jgi:3D (Asp-Asp-Asp) domain-containing protein